MSSALDRELMALSLEEEEVPFLMPDLPQLRSTQRNLLSIIGRIVNPDCQKVANVVRDMPRMWQKKDRVRGIVLSKERFQFIFNSEHDLVEVLEKGIQNHNLWALVLERWVEAPPSDFLQFVSIWVQISNIPVDYYNEAAIEQLGEIVGKVDTVAFDPTISHLQDYVRVKILIDVSKPLRRSKVINEKSGGSFTLFFNYERVQKRCFCCQRLTHEQDKCPLFALQQKKRDDGSPSSSGRKERREPFLKPSDPLFGVLTEDQVGVDRMIGRPRIAPEVLEEMRNYLKGASEWEKPSRVQKVKVTVAEALQDPVAAKSTLRLEKPTSFSADEDKGKGRVFDFEEPSSIAGDAGSFNRVAEPDVRQDFAIPQEDLRYKLSRSKAASDGGARVRGGVTISGSSTVQWRSSSENLPSRTRGRKKRRRFRPSKGQRHSLPLDLESSGFKAGIFSELDGEVNLKRKCLENNSGMEGSSKRRNNSVISTLGLPNSL